VSRRDSYAIRISGLVDGNHDFSFELDEKFFASLDESIIEKGRLEAQVVLEKKTGVLAMHFSLKGEVEVLCDRCLEPFMTMVESEQTIFVKFGETHGELEDDMIMIHKDDYEIEVGQLMYEFIVLALPYSKVHPDNEQGRSGCNPEMLQKLSEHQGEADNEIEIDPRWDALRGIKDN